MQNVEAATNLECVNDLDQARVAKGPELAEGIAGQRELGAVSRNIEGEYAALGTVFLQRPSAVTGRGGDDTLFVPL